jgi:hypothetical protein
VGFLVDRKSEPGLEARSLCHIPTQKYIQWLKTSRLPPCFSTSVSGLFTGNHVQEMGL